jgi:hypothetical protein
VRRCACSGCAERLRRCGSQGVKNERHRARLVALASETLMFRSPAELTGAHAAAARGARRSTRAVKRALYHVTPPALLRRRAERLYALRQALWLAAGIYDADVGAMVGRYPRVVCGDLAVSAALKLSALAAGLPGIDLKRLLQASPQLLSLEPQATVVARAHALAALLPRRDVLRMCELHPPLLTVSVPRTVAPALAALRQALAAHGAPGEGVAERCAECTPRLLTSAPATVAARMALLERLAPGTVAALAGKPNALGRLLCASQRALLRIAYLAECAPHARLGPTRAVGLPAAQFEARFPGFAAWVDAPGRLPPEAQAGGAQRAR